MSEEMMFGKCQCCGKEAQLTRTYFRYPVKCECHSPTHFESVEHCGDCIPKEPTYTKVEFKTEDLKNPVAMAMKVVKTEISKDKSETLQAKAKRLIELVNNPYCLGPAALLEGVKEVIPALIAENELLRQERDSQQRVAIKEMEKVKALTADKDEQTEQMKYLLRRTLPILEATNNQQELIEAIDALLGGAEDGK